MTYIQITPVNAYCKVWSHSQLDVRTLSVVVGLINSEIDVPNLLIAINFFAPYRTLLQNRIIHASHYRIIFGQSGLIHQFIQYELSMFQCAFCEGLRVRRLSYSQFSLI